MTICLKFLIFLFILVRKDLSFRVFRNHGRKIHFQSTVSDESISSVSTTNGRSNDLLVITNSKSYSYFKTKPYDLSITWHEVFSKIANKMIWEGKNNKYEPIEGDLNIRIFDIEDIVSTIASKSTAVERFFADAMVLVGLGNDESSPQYESALSTLTAAANAVTVFNCSSSISKLEKYGEFYPNSINSIFDPLLQKFDELSNSRRNTDRKRYDIAVDLWKRNSLDDLVFLMFILIDTYGKYRIKSVQSVTSTEATSFDQVLCMCTNCSKEMLDCFKDETCRKVIDQDYALNVLCIRGLSSVNTFTQRLWIA